MIRSFIYAWLIYWVAVALLPVHSIYPAVVQAFFLQLGFVALVVFGYFVASPRSREILMPYAINGEIRATRGLVTLAFYMSLAGFVFLLFDKVYVQGIDYSNGLAIAREQWKELGEEREGKASSIWSVLGYVFGSAYYVAMVLVITQTRQFSRRRRLVSIVVCFVFALANSIITGGRSNFMLLGAVALCAFSARRGLRVRDVLTSRKQRRYVTAICVLTAGYIVFVFYGRAAAGNQLVYMYVVSFLPYMGLDFDEWYRQSVTSGWLGAIGNMSILVIGYLTHSFATVAAIIDAPQEDKTIIFNNFISIFYKLGLMDRPDDEWFLKGRFPSVPGALWHQFGPAAYLISSFLLGVAAALASLWARLRPHRLLPLGVQILTATTLILTPYVFAPDFLAFPSVLVAFVMLSPLARLGRARRRQVVQPVPDTQ